MQSIKQLYKIGRGPSSSHTMGPFFASEIIKTRYPQLPSIQVTLYNSLALTGEGHLTYEVIRSTLAPMEVIFQSKIDLNRHPNTLVFENQAASIYHEVKSIGGGDIVFDQDSSEKKYIYPHHLFSEIASYCKAMNLSLVDYIYSIEDQDFQSFLKKVWRQMKQTIEVGLQQDGILPGTLQVKRKAKELITYPMQKENDAVKENRYISAYAFAVGEENASGGMIVTAPTCGASGILPAVLYYKYKKEKLPEKKIIQALAIAGLIGNLIKHNATISGAVGGCQAEVGSACAMAAAAHVSLASTSLDQIEYAAEIALEHHLGLTCDPVDGYVQIPCIERNAVGAIRAINASRVSYILSGSRKISFDMIVQTMYQTGLDMHPKYKETAEAGMAYFYKTLNKKVD